MIKTKNSKNIKIKIYNSIDDEFKDIKNKRQKNDLKFLKDQKKYYIF